MKKQGVSLIVLVITIIVMIILSSTVIMSLSNSGIIQKAQDAVDANNLNQAQNIAMLAWSEWYLNNMKDPESGVTAEEYVKTKLEDNGVSIDKYIPIVTENGAFVAARSTLGDLITGPDDYGKMVDYTVTVDGKTYSDWQIYYHNNDYVYIIASEPLGVVTLNKGTEVSSLTSDELALYEKFRVGNYTKYTLTDELVDTAHGSRAVAQLIKDYANFANTTDYGTNVEGTIGGPTVELLVAGWNAKKYTPEMSLTTSDFGYKVNNNLNIDVTSDGLYIPSDYKYWLASPSARSVTYVMCAGTDNTGRTAVANAYYGDKINNVVRPVVCLKSSIPATVGIGNYDFHLIEVSQ